MRLIFTADWFVDNFKRGAELNDDALLGHLGLDFEKIRCEEIDKVDPDAVYLVGNFTTMSEEVKKDFVEHGKYIIYEHDHKYCVTRNPYTYMIITDDGPKQVANPTGQVPKDNLINLDFYQKAHKVVCLTDWHEEQLKMNIPDCKLTNIHGSMWTGGDLQYIDSIRESVKKSDKCAIFNDQEIVTLEDGTVYRQGPNIKNKQGNIKYCQERSIPYRLIPRINDRERFLKTLAKHSSLCFFPEIPETCSRLLVEARMLGLEVHTDRFSGASREYWFHLSGQELTDHYRNVIIPGAVTLFKGLFNECNSDSDSQ